MSDIIFGASLVKGPKRAYCYRIFMHSCPDHDPRATTVIGLGGLLDLGYARLMKWRMGFIETLATL
jgi:hypothetical protein